MIFVRLLLSLILSMAGLVCIGDAVGVLDIPNLPDRANPVLVLTLILAAFFVSPVGDTRFRLRGIGAILMVVGGVAFLGGLFAFDQPRILGGLAGLAIGVPLYRTFREYSTC